MKIALFICFLFVVTVQSQIKTSDKQLSKEAVAFSKTIILNPPTFFMPKTIENVDKPLSFFGKAHPGATVTFMITPISNGGSKKPVLVAGGSQNPYEMQTYNVAANEKGGWSVKGVTVKFREGAKNRRVEIIMAQKINNSTSKMKAVNFQLKDEPILMVMEKVKFKNSVLTISLESISNNDAQKAIKLGISQWTDVWANNTSMADRTNQNNEIVCWWDGICQQPRLFTGTTSVGNSRSYIITPQAMTNTQSPPTIDIWTKYIANYPVSKKDLEVKNFVAPHTLFFKKTVSQLDVNGFQHDKIPIKEVQEKGGTLYKDIQVNFNNQVITMKYKITLVAEK
ncbi:MAG: hypothetical protein V7724_04340 [Sediminicola sp.]